MTKRNAITAGLVFVLGAAVGALAWFAPGWAERGRATTTTAQPVWTETQWPFPMDQWGKGKAFQCRAADCGSDVNLYIRAKIGFCNCTTGVADDEGRERLSDFGFLGNDVAPLGAGRPIMVAWMNGRSRAYAIGSPGRAGKS